jgi:hypothetical protein
METCKCVQHAFGIQTLGSSDVRRNNIMTHTRVPQVLKREHFADPTTTEVTRALTL